MPGHLARNWGCNASDWFGFDAIPSVTIPTPKKSPDKSEFIRFVDCVITVVLCSLESTRPQFVIKPKPNGNITIVFATALPSNTHMRWIRVQNISAHRKSLGTSQLRWLVLGDATHFNNNKKNKAKQNTKKKFFAKNTKLKCWIHSCKLPGKGNIANNFRFDDDKCDWNRSTRRDERIWIAA